MIMQYSVEQKIIPRAFTVDELFDDVTRNLRALILTARPKVRRRRQCRPSFEALAL